MKFTKIRVDQLDFNGPTPTKPPVHVLRKIPALIARRAYTVRATFRGTVIAVRCARRNYFDLISKVAGGKFALRVRSCSCARPASVVSPTTLFVTRDPLFSHLRLSLCASLFLSLSLALTASSSSYRRLSSAKLLAQASRPIRPVLRERNACSRN